MVRQAHHEAGSVSGDDCMIESSAWSDPQLRASIWPRSNRITATSSSTGAWRAGSSRPRPIAVVKANAYGHGAAQVALALEDAGADLLACADIEEGAALRAAGVRADILVFGALSVSDLDGVFDCRLTPTISTPGAARAVQAAAARHQQRQPYRLKIDTGMNRLGFRYDNLQRTLPEVFASPNLHLEAVYTHFATADDPESPLFNDQRVRFERALEYVFADSRWGRSTDRPYRHARQQRGAAARLARLVRPGAARPAPLRTGAAAACVDALAHARDHARQPNRGREGRPAR